VAWADLHDRATAVEFSVDGLYLLRLTATDGALFASDDVVVRVNPVNAPPVVSAGPDQTIASDHTALAGAVTDDGLPLGGALSAAWSMVSGPGHVTFVDPTAASTSASFSADGDYLLVSTVYDESNPSAVKDQAEYAFTVSPNGTVLVPASAPGTGM
jgi:hypothetical protein